MLSFGHWLGYIDPGTGFVVYGIFDWLLGVVIGFLLAFWAYLKGFWLRFKKQRSWQIAAAIALLLVIGVIGFYMGNRHTVAANRPRVIVLGFDGLSPKLFERWAAKGYLPNLDKLAKNGGYSHLATTLPPHSPIAWASFATGMNPDKHGIRDFIQRDPQSYELSLSSSKISKRGKPEEVLNSPRWWQIASEESVNSDILFCPVSFPPAAFTGRLLAGMGVPDVLGTEGTFTYFTSEDDQKAAGLESGQVVRLGRSSTVVLELPGPRVGNWRGQVKRAAVPMRLDRLPNGARLTWEQGSVVLSPQQYSDWQPVTFALGWGRKMSAIVRFVLLESEPNWCLYASAVQYDPRNPYLPLSYPKDFAGTVAKECGLYATLGMPGETWPVNTGILSDEQLLSQTELVFQERLRIFRRVFGERRPGALMAYFDTTDTVSHMFWRQLQTTIKAGGDETTSPICQYYRRCDELVGEVLSDLAGQDVLLVLSDHGFTSFERSVNLNSFLREKGWLTRAGADSTLLRSVDWANTKCYAAGFGAIYLNLVGREGQGVVHPEQAEVIKQQLKEQLESWRDSNGQRVVNQAYLMPISSSGPDIVVGYNHGYRASWQTAMGACPEQLIEDNTLAWSGDHLVDPQLVPGVLFSNRPLPKSAVMTDVAPTILQALVCADELIEKAGFAGRSLWSKSGP